MALASVSNLERGEYQQVSHENVLLNVQPPTQASWRHPALVFGSSFGALFLIGAVVFGSQGGISASNATTHQLHKAVVEESIVASSTGNHTSSIVLHGSGEVAANASDEPTVMAAAATTTTTTTTAATTSTSVTTTTTTATVTTTTTDLIPPEHRHDGNSCEDYEEDFLGLCYKTCSNLTNGVYPVRSSPFSCCKNADCFSRDKVRTWIPCQGYDINAQGGCPHKPGACLVDEEYFMGLCYKKCSILTNGSYRHRSAPATCCKTEGWKCLDAVAEDWTDKAFAVGGGKGDNKSSTPSRVHGPLHKLTEGSAAISPALDDSHVLDSNLKPTEALHDENKCEDNEELHAKLCYKKCSILTNGEYPKRSTAFTCCKAEGCLLNFKMASDVPIPCQGYDVSGHDSCPHAPGACLEDEQFFLGLCYAKCHLLTNGKYPYRVGPMTCCQVNDEEKCLDPFSDSNVSDTSNLYDIAGGGGDHDKETPGSVHGPLGFLTELS